MKTLMIITAVFLSVICFGLEVDEVYQNFCANCHGAKFQGGNAKSLVDGVWEYGSSRGHISRNIKFGITHLGMPAYEKSLTEGQISQLVDYLLDAEKKAGAVPPSIPQMLQTLEYDINVSVLAEGLEIPWDLAFLNEDYALVTERPGRLRAIKNGKLLPEPVQNIPSVVAEGQGGLLAVAFDPEYGKDKNQWIYLAYSHGLETDVNRRVRTMTRVVRGEIINNAWTNQQVVFEAPAETYRTTRHHYGTRIVFDADHNLYFSIGDRGAGMDSQDLSMPSGKIHRVRRDGSVPPDNPFVKTEKAMPSIFSLGNRNAQGMSVHPKTGQLWISEHGPLGGDEINLIRPGVNYGWPVISYGKNYDGSKFTDLYRKDGMQQPAYYWNPSTAVCGIDFYSGDLFPKWNNRLLVGALKYEDVRVLNIEDDRVMHDEVILKNAGRVRDVVCGPDGAIYVVLNKPGKILRLTPDSKL